MNMKTKFKKSIWKTAFGYQFNIDNEEICIYSRKDANIQTKEEAIEASNSIVEFCKDMIEQNKKLQIYKEIGTLFPKYV